MLVDDNRLKKIKELEEKLGFEFNDKELINKAFIHRSFSNEILKSRNINYERLEFLGDAVLELVFTEILYKFFPRKTEGDLTKIRSKLVREESFAELSDKLELSSLLLLGKGEEITGGREKASIKADIFESLAGAIYLDCGYDFVFNYISNMVQDNIDEISLTKGPINSYKVILQEHLNSKKNRVPSYVLDKEEGKDHDKTFFISVFDGKVKLGEGSGKNKKEAEQMAAQNALKKLNLI